MTTVPVLLYYMEHNSNHGAPEGKRQRMRIDGHRINFRKTYILAGILLAWLFAVMWTVFLPASSYAAEGEKAPANCWIYEDGSYHYTDGKGEAVRKRMITPAEGHSYYMDEEGILKYGVFTVGGKSYTADAGGWIRFRNGWLIFGGSWNAADSGQAGEKKNCLMKENGIWYYIDADGNYGDEVLVTDNTSVIIGNDGEGSEGENSAASDGSRLSCSDGETPVFPEKLLRVYISGGKTGFPGWVQSESGWCFADEEGTVPENTVIRDASGKLLMIGEEGKPSGGICMCGNTRYAFNENGALVNEAGWAEYNGNKYYVNSSGEVYRNQVFQADGSTYFAGSDGRLTGGFHSLDGRKRYFEEDGRMRDQAGWIDVEGERYYINTSSKVITGGPIEIDGKYYCFENSGELKKGKIPAGDMSFYYTDDNGAFLTDTDFTIDGITYHAGETGEVFVGTMYEKAQGYSSNTGYLIMVNLATQRTAVFEGSKGNWRLMREMIVSTGAPINPTPKGEYATTVHSLHFNAYGVRAWYATGFIGGKYLFHSSPYEIDSEPRVCTDSRLGVPASHGCVRMALEDAKWMYDTLPLTTKVVIY